MHEQTSEQTLETLSLCLKGRIFLRNSDSLLYCLCHPCILPDRHPSQSSVPVSSSEVCSVVSGRRHRDKGTSAVLAILQISVEHKQQTLHMASDLVQNTQHLLPTTRNLVLLDMNHDYSEFELESKAQWTHSVL